MSPAAIDERATRVRPIQPVPVDERTIDAGEESCYGPSAGGDRPNKQKESSTLEPKNTRALPTQRRQDAPSQGPGVLKIEPLADGEASVLTALARIDARILHTHKQEPYWAERIAKLKEGLTTQFATQIAAYLLGDKTCGNDASPAERAAWSFARDMMVQVQPGFREKLAQEQGGLATLAR